MALSWLDANILKLHLKFLAIHGATSSGPNLKLMKALKKLKSILKCTVRIKFFSKLLKKSYFCVCHILHFLIMSVYKLNHENCSSVLC